ncbi:YdcH family protein [Loktanella sp. R86503]|uniref:YdcH family protein n=1 Tax=Loktanella sp. R86503 TaxID=3093847 RepID=UPI0036DF1641
MSNTPHELSEEFPAQADQIKSLRTTNAHFAKLADTYHEVNRAVHRAETDVEPTSDAHMADLRKQRLHLKDQIAAALSAANN